MRRAVSLQLQCLVPLAASVLTACTTAPTAPVTAPAGWAAPEVLAGSVVGNALWQVDRNTGKLYASQVFLGDALWQPDVAGVAPPRPIAKDLGGLNGFEVGPDGFICGPLWFKNSVVKVDPANGAITVINSEFKTPAAANLGGKGNLWVIDTATGELSCVALATGRKTVVKQLKTSIDNLAIAPDGTVYIASMADNLIEAHTPATGALRTLTSGKLAVPAGIKLSGNTLWVADIFAFRKVDVGSGAVTDLKRMQASGAACATRTVPASGINGPVQMVLSQDGALHVTEAAETAAARLTGINLQTGQRRTVSDKLPIDLAAGPGLPPPYVPTGVDVASDGTVYFSADRNNAIQRI